MCKRNKIAELIATCKHAGSLLSNVTKRIGSIAFSNPYKFTGVVIYWLLQIYVMYVIHKAVGTLIFISGLVLLNIVIGLYAHKLRKLFRLSK